MRTVSVLFSIHCLASRELSVHRITTVSRIFVPTPAERGPGADLLIVETSIADRFNHSGRPPGVDIDRSQARLQASQPGSGLHFRQRTPRYGRSGNRAEMVL